jgi:ketosteroid isomerase-like protein
MASAADDIAADIIAKWSAAFAKLDAAALSSLYSTHVLFYGSNPTLYRGRDGVKSYFTGLPHWNARSVQFSGVSTEAAGSDVVNMAGTADFPSTARASR